MRISTLRQTMWLLLRSARPRQWLKNLSLFVPLVFGGGFFIINRFLTVAEAFIIFCVVSSSLYLINDIVDAPRDRRHPFKKARPIAAGLLPVKTALIIAIVGLSVGVVAAFRLQTYFFIIVLIFIAIQLAYSFFLRHIIILDAMTIAFSFILRVFAGAWVLPVPLSSWLVLTTIGLSLLLAFGKRRSEKTILEQEQTNLETRNTLRHYPDTLLDSMISLSAAYTVFSYSLFAFQTSPLPSNNLFWSFLPPTSAKPKLMLLTVPIIIYAVARYLYVIYEKKEGESPERVLLSDYPLLVSVILCTITIILIFYYV